MDETRRPLTAAHIRYLLTLWDLEQTTQQKGIRCVEIAGALGVTKSSVHTMLENLRGMGLIEKDRYSKAYFTPQGRAFAGLCSDWYQSVYRYLDAGLQSGILPQAADIRTAACAVLTQLPPPQTAAV